MAYRVALIFDAEHPDRPCRPGVTDNGPAFMRLDELPARNIALEPA